MTFAEYQAAARRTQNPELSINETLEHALWGLASECGEVCGLFQKRLQGHAIEADAVLKEIGDVLWMLAELCDVLEMDLGHVAGENIEKLKRGYPNGFEAWRSVGRDEE